MCMCYCSGGGNSNGTSKLSCLFSLSKQCRKIVQPHLNLFVKNFGFYFVLGTAAAVHFVCAFYFIFFSFHRRKKIMKNITHVSRSLWHTQNQNRVYVSAILRNGFSLQLYYDLYAYVHENKYNETHLLQRIHLIRSISMCDKEKGKNMLPSPLSQPNLHIVQACHDGLEFQGFFWSGYMR